MRVALRRIPNLNICGFIWETIPTHHTAVTQQQLWVCALSVSSSWKWKEGWGGGDHPTAAITRDAMGSMLQEAGVQRHCLPPVKYPSGKSPFRALPRYGFWPFSRGWNDKGFEFSKPMHEVFLVHYLKYTFLSLSLSLSLILSLSCDLKKSSPQPRTEF